MKTTISSILVLGCLIGLLLAGCASPQKSPSNNTSEPYANQQVLVKGDGTFYVATNFVFIPGSAQYPFATNRTDSDIINKYANTLVSTIVHDWQKRMVKVQSNTTATGKTVVKFSLHPDGSVSDVTVVSSTVNEWLTSLCTLTVGVNAPYTPWPDDVRKIINRDNWEITITFDYTGH